jgi:hypothetical protein
MLKATDYEILRGVKVSGLTKIPMERQPVRVATLLDEKAFNEDQYLIHHKTVFLEDRVHDWDWRSGQFRYYTRVADVADVLVVYEIEDVAPTARFNAMTGEPLSH